MRARLSGGVRTQGTGIEMLRKARNFFVKPEKISSFVVMLVGLCLHVAGALALQNRLVVLAGWLIGAIGVINYIRWFVSPSVEPRVRQPWDSK
jgi:hypothetical protein